MVVSNKVLVRFSESWGRMGSIESVFVSTKDRISNLIGKGFYFGEILGKHSEVSGKFLESNFKVITDDQAFITKAEEMFKGFLPFGNVDVEEGRERAAEHEAQR